MQQWKLFLSWFKINRFESLEVYEKDYRLTVVLFWTLKQFPEEAGFAKA